MGGTKPIMDGLRAAVRANTIDIRANAKDRVRVDVVWNQEPSSDPRDYVGISCRFCLRGSMCIYARQVRDDHMLQ